MDKRARNLSLTGNLTLNGGTIKVISGNTTYTLNIDKCRELGILV